MKLERIVSMLPGATEICCALGLADRLVGVSHECDFPAEVRGRPVVTRASIDVHAGAAEIDRQVRAQVSRGLSLYHVDEDRLRELAPDRIVTQDACAICAVSREQVVEAVRKILDRDVPVVSLVPLTLDDVMGDIERVGAAAGVPDRGRRLAGRCRARLAELESLTAAWPHPRLLVLEWTDPPMVAGHWTPRLIKIAGGDPILGHDAEPTGTTARDRIAAADPEAVLIAPCGFGVDQVRRELPALLAQPGFAALPAVQRGAVWLADGNAFFNRPGQRLVESAQIAALAMHGDRLAGCFAFGPGSLSRI